MKFKFRGEWRGESLVWGGPTKVNVFMPRKFTGGGWTEQ